MALTRRALFRRAAAIPVAAAVATAVPASAPAFVPQSSHHLAQTRALVEQGWMSRAEATSRAGIRTSGDPDIEAALAARHRGDLAGEMRALAGIKVAKS